MEKPFSLTRKAQAMIEINEALENPERFGFDKIPHFSLTEKNNGRRKRRRRSRVYSTDGISR